MPIVVVIRGLLYKATGPLSPEAKESVVKFCASMGLGNEASISVAWDAALSFERRDPVGTSRKRIGISFASERAAQLFELVLPCCTSTNDYGNLTEYFHLARRYAAGVQIEAEGPLAVVAGQGAFEVALPETDPLHLKEQAKPIQALYLVSLMTSVIGSLPLTITSAQHAEQAFIISTSDPDFETLYATDLAALRQITHPGHIVIHKGSDTVPIDLALDHFLMTEEGDSVHIWLRIESDPEEIIAKIKERGLDVALARPWKTEAELPFVLAGADPTML